MSRWYFFCFCVLFFRNKHEPIQLCMVSKFRCRCVHPIPSKHHHCTTLLLAPTVSLSTVVYSITVTPIGAWLSHNQYHGRHHQQSHLRPRLPCHRRCVTSVHRVTLTASPSGGVWSGNTAVAPNGLFSPAIAAQSYQYRALHHQHWQLPGECVRYSCMWPSTTPLLSRPVCLYNVCRILRSIS
jgi:hypothetical protein